ncbi:hypothetical protein J6590_095576 [Homalodisca vitripennis]|nr:hypothetical protein J6590_095576 [Homalodisca vitripennis]
MLCIHYRTKMLCLVTGHITRRETVTPRTHHKKRNCHSEVCISLQQRQYLPLVYGQNVVYKVPVVLLQETTQEEKLSLSGHIKRRETVTPKYVSHNNKDNMLLLTSSKCFV